jgi:glycosyltransferase involved in cell wall biosynthesis
MRIFLNAVGASCSSGFTYLRNVVPELSRATGIHTIIAANAAMRSELGEWSNISWLDLDIPLRTAKRFWLEQAILPEAVRRSNADVLICTGNFALRNSPVPQILLSGNSLYTSPDFSRDLWSRREYGLWIDNRIKAVMARNSIRWADLAVAPSQAFADQLQKWTGNPVRCIHHGFNPELFFRSQEPLPAQIRQKLENASEALCLLFVSHYNYYRNFETLLRAIPTIRRQISPRKVRLLLTCELKNGANPGAYRTDRAAELVRELDLGEEVVQLGSIPYESLHHVYRAAHIYVTPAYAETFAHPLVEAMASGLPLVASDLPVHREICRDAALYFPRFSPDSLAGRVVQIATLDPLRKQLCNHAVNRSRDFCWAKHVESLLARASELTRQQAPSMLPVSLTA